MVATIERPVNRLPVVPLTPLVRTDGSAARALARGYLDYVSALWRGDSAALVFASWLNTFWCPRLPAAPQAPPDAWSPHGAAGCGIRWYEVAGEVRGYAHGARGGYRVPIDMVPPPTTFQARKLR